MTYGLKVINVTDNQVIFQSSCERGATPKNGQINTPEIGVWDFFEFCRSE